MWEAPREYDFIITDPPLLMYTKTIELVFLIPRVMGAMAFMAFMAVMAVMAFVPIFVNYTVINLLPMFKIKH